MTARVAVIIDIAWTDIVHFMLRLEIDASSVEILQDDTAHCRGGLGRKIESLVRDLLRRDGPLAMPSGGRSEKQRPADPYARA